MKTLSIATGPILIWPQTVFPYYAIQIVEIDTNASLHLLHLTINFKMILAFTKEIILLHIFRFKQPRIYMRMGDFKSTWYMHKE